jgi:hypothetical protein
MSIYKYILLFIGVCYCINSTYTQSYSTVVYTVRDGLGSNNTNDVYSDNNGVVWTSCFYAGVGYLENNRFKMFTTNDGLCSDVSQIFGSSRGVIFFWDTTKGVSVWDDGKLTPFTSIKQGWGKRIFVDSLSNGELRVVTNDGRTYIYDRSANVFTPSAKIQNIVQAGFDLDLIIHDYPKSKHIYFSNNGKLLQVLIQENGQQTYIPTKITNNNIQIAYISTLSDKGGLVARHNGKQCIYKYDGKVWVAMPNTLLKEGKYLSIMA